MGYLKFDITKLEKLNDPGRFDSLPPDVFWQALGSPDGASAIVEIGAGTGLFAAEWARRAPGAVVYAADTSARMLDWVRANRPEVAAGRIVPLQTSETGVPLGDGVADAVVMINLHHELADPAGTYAEAFRLLGPGGRVLVVDWARRETPKGPPQEVRVGPDELAALLADAGFSDIAVRDDALTWHVMAVASKPAA